MKYQPWIQNSKVIISLKIKSSTKKWPNSSVKNHITFWRMGKNHERAAFGLIITSDKILKDKQNDHHFWVIYATENSSWLEWFFPIEKQVTNFFKCLIIMLTLFSFNGENYLLPKKKVIKRQRVNLKENCHKKNLALNEAR